MSEEKEVNEIKSSFDKEKFLLRLVDAFLRRTQNENITYDGFKLAITNYARNTRKDEMDSLIEILDRTYKYFSNQEFRNIIMNSGITAQQFVTKFGEKILGDNKRKYNMSNMFNEGLIASKKDGQKTIKYMSKAGVEHCFLDWDGKKIIIQEIGKLYFVEGLGVQYDISKYRVMRQMSGNNYCIDEVFSDIRFIKMDEPEYRQAVFDELLSQNNIQLSNAGGYVGRISETLVDSKEFGVGNERIGGETYSYR